MEELKDYIIAQCKEMKKNGTQCMYETIAANIEKEFGVLYDPENIRAISRRYRKSNGLSELFEPYGNEYECKRTVEFLSNGDQSMTNNISFIDGEPLTPEALLEKHGVDKNKFTLVSAKNSVWKTVVKNGKTERLYSSKITIKPKNSYSWNQENIDRIFNEINGMVRTVPAQKEIFEDNGKVLVIPIVDLHYAMYASYESTGNEYNENIAKERFYTVLANTMNRVRDKHFEEIIFPIGCDILNFDTKDYTTTKGTRQDSCVETEKSIIDVTDMLINAVEYLKRYSKVRVIYVPGNHDYMTGAGIANTLRVAYRNDKDVAVDYASRMRKYTVFGKVLIGFAHDIDMNKVNNIVQADARGLVGDTNRTVYFVSHLHHEEVKDVSGTDVRRLPTVSGLSKWTYEKGYNAVRKNASFIIDSQYGITDVLYSFVE